MKILNIGREQVRDIQANIEIVKKNVERGWRNWVTDVTTRRIEKGRKYITLPRSVSPNHPVSKRFRTIFEIKWLKAAIGVPLAGTTLLGTIMAPVPVMGSSTILDKEEKEPISVTTEVKIQESGENIITEKAIKRPLDEMVISQNYHQWHPAVDLRTEWGSPVYAIAKGEIEEVNYWRWGYGNHIVIKHGNGRRSLYAHLSTIGVSKGEEVDGGDKIGEVGTTGHSTGSHLHLEISDDGRRLNPTEVMEIW